MDIDKKNLNQIKKNTRAEKLAIQNKNRDKNNKLKIHITTLGCSKNLYDSEILMGQLKANDVNLIDDPWQANVLIVNTCGFITPAKQESIDAILEAGRLKKEHPEKKLLVCGCLSKRYQKELRKDIPEAMKKDGKLVV